MCHDYLQTIIMYSSMVFIVLKGVIEEGGVRQVWETSKKFGRIEFSDWDPYPTTRHTNWSLVIGGYFMWLAIYGCNQAQVSYSLE